MNQVIALAPSNHPTTLSGITELGKLVRLFGPAMTGLDLIRDARRGISGPTSPRSAGAVLPAGQRAGRDAGRGGST